MVSLASIHWIPEAPSSQCGNQSLWVVSCPLGGRITLAETPCSTSLGFCLWRLASVILTTSGFLSWQPESGQGPPAPLMGTCQTTHDGVKHILDVGTAGVLPDTGEDPVSSDGRFWRCWSLVQVGVTSPRPCPTGGPSGEGPALGSNTPKLWRGPTWLGSQAHCSQLCGSWDTPSPSTSFPHLMEGQA